MPTKAHVNGEHPDIFSLVQLPFCVLTIHSLFSCTDIIGRPTVCYSAHTQCAHMQHVQYHLDLGSSKLHHIQSEESSHSRYEPITYHHLHSTNYLLLRPASKIFKFHSFIIIIVISGRPVEGRWLLGKAVANERNCSRCFLYKPSRKNNLHQRHVSCRLEDAH